MMNSFAIGVGGAYDSVPEAQARMTGVKPMTYVPNISHAAAYNRLYKVYRQLHDAFGGITSEGSLKDAMKSLIAIRGEARQTQA